MNPSLSKEKGKKGGGNLFKKVQRCLITSHSRIQKTEGPYKKKIPTWKVSFLKLVVLKFLLFRQFLSAWELTATVLNPGMQASPSCWSCGWNPNKVFLSGFPLQ